jgi:hypothetical protein
MKSTPADRVFLMNAFRVLAGFALVWSLGAIYRTTVTKPIDLPVIGKISYSGAVLVTIPVVSVLVCLLSAILVVFALSSRVVPGQTLYRVLPIFGPISGSLRRITAVLILAIVLFLNVILIVLFVKMSQMQIRAHDEGAVLQGPQIYGFQHPHDWRWIDPKDPDERPSAFPGWQPNIYLALVAIDWCGFLLVLSALIWPPLWRQSRH